MVIGGRLQLSWNYSQHRFRRETMERLAQRAMAEIRALIEQCRRGEDTGYTPSDFPLMKFRQTELDGLLTKLSSGGGMIEDIYPLSPMQQGMLFHSLYEPQSGIYTQQLSCCLQGELNLAAFERAWQQVMNRHSLLRTAFVWEHRDEPCQVLYKDVPLPLERYDWRGLAPLEQQRKLETFLETERRRSFNVSDAPLMRLAIIQLSESAYQFVWNIHHLLLDGWSHPLLLKEVFTFYEAFRQGQELSLAAPHPYKDYISWLQQQDLSQAERFWREMLQDFTAPTPLILSETLVSHQHEKVYEEQQISLTRETTAALHTFFQQHQLTLNTVLQGAWAILLSRYSGQEDVVFGTTVSGRPADLRGVETMVGIFINTLPVRVRISPNASLVSWLQQLQAQLVEMRQYEYSPLAQVQKWSGVPPGSPLFESLLVFENYPMDATLREQSRSLVITDVIVNEMQSYPLTVIVGPGRELSLRVIYETPRLNAAAIQRMLGHFQTLLENIFTDPQWLLMEIPLSAQNAFLESASINQLKDKAEEFHFSYER